MVHRGKRQLGRRGQGETSWNPQQYWDTRQPPGILHRMAAWPVLLFRLAVATLQRRRDLLLENLALRHQLLVLHRTARPPRLSGPDRALWVWLARRWRAWRTCLRIVRPDTVIHWHRAGFRLFWKWRSRPGRAGRRPSDGKLVSLNSASRPTRCGSRRTWNG